MLDMPSLGDAIALRNRIIKLEREVKALKLKNLNSRTEICHLRKKLKMSKPKSKKQEIITLLSSGLTPSQVRDQHGYDYDYVRQLSSEISTYKKAAKVN